MHAKDRYYMLKSKIVCNSQISYAKSKKNCMETSNISMQNPKMSCKSKTLHAKATYWYAKLKNSNFYINKLLFRHTK